MSAHPTNRGDRNQQKKDHKGSDCARSLKAWRDHHRRRPDVGEMEVEDEPLLTLPPAYMLTQLPAEVGRLTATGCFISS